MSTWQDTLLQMARVAHLATVDPHGQPHLVPVVFAYAAQRLFTPLDGKPKRVAGQQLQRARNIATNDRVAVVVDHYAEDWQHLAWVQLHGRAMLVAEGAIYAEGLALLHARYPQYATLPLAGHALLVIAVERLLSWRFTPEGA